MFRLRRLAAAAAAAAAALMAAAVVAPAAGAATFTDTSLQAFAVSQTCTAPGSITGVTAANTVTYTPASGQTLASPAISGQTDTFDAAAAVNSTGQVVVSVPAASTGTGQGVLTFKISADGCTTVETVIIGESAGLLTAGTTSTDQITSVGAVNQNPTGCVEFTDTVGTGTAGSSAAATESNLPAGLVSAQPLCPGTALPGTYNDLAGTVTDADGAAATFGSGLKVTGHAVHGQTDFGNWVNGYGNGPDVSHAAYHAGTVVVGWTAAKGDQATLWIREAEGTAPDGATIYRLEATRAGTGGNGAATGLCMSDPLGGWPDPAGPTGLIVTPCNPNVFQQFYMNTAGNLISVADGQLVNPDGTGAQLRTAATPVPWAGGSVYRWADYAQLPG